MAKTITKWDWAAITIIIIGALIRLYPIMVFPFDEPFRLGGLFYEFSRQIANNNFGFPEYIPYYSLNGIPFAYPPLSFYFQAFLIKFFQPPLFITVNLLPPLVTILSLPAFYWLIRQFTDDSRLVLGSLFAFALIPPAFKNQIEAAGLAESFGLLALIIYLGFLLRWKNGLKWIDAILAGLSLAFCIVSSPGSAYAATLFSVLLFIWICLQGLKNRTLKPIVMLGFIGVIALLTSSPFWLTVMQNHGNDFFITPFIAQHQGILPTIQIEHIISFQPAGELLSFPWNWLILAGLIWAVLKNYRLIVLLFLVFWLIPREGLWLVSIPGAILAGIGVIYICKPLFEKFLHNPKNALPPIGFGILAILFFITVFANILFTFNNLVSDESEWYVSRDQVRALRNFKDSIPAEGRVIIISNTGVAEWAPAILQREVLNIEYGLEWQPDELELVEAINNNLKDRDFNGMTAATKIYSDDPLVYIIAAPEDLDQMIKETEQNISEIDSSPPLNLYILYINY